MRGCAGDDLLESNHETFFTKVFLPNFGNHRLPVGMESGLGIAFLSRLNI